MKKSRFAQQKIAFVLWQAGEGTPIAAVCRKVGISDASRRQGIGGHSARYVVRWCRQWIGT
jgi:hypothetical protein